MIIMQPKNPSHFLSLIIPVYKQEQTIVKNIKQIKIALDSIRYDHEIIVVIDGKLDKSNEKLNEANLDKVKIISYIKNQGKSYAIQTGMKKAKGDYVMFIDSGMEIDPNGISMLLEHMEWYNADIIVGSKRHPASQITYATSRKILSEGYYRFVQLLFGIKIRDTQAGIKIFRKQVLEKVLPRLVEKKFAGDLEILVVANSLGFKRIFEAPIKLDYTMGSLTSAATVTAIYHIVLDTLAIWYRKNILQYYKRKSN
ncbi:MAG: glycosyltransferase family 2 protein [bacterium]|nr:glycosyltransferase family 2 protein [bacterium]